jgi:hypothetical protein
LKVRVKVTGLAQKLAQLEAAHMDFQSKYWTNLKLLGQPCNFYAGGVRDARFIASGCGPSCSDSAAARSCIWLGLF